jgi:predicted Fe-Mo cluster-binding NifX family protein
MIPIIQFRNRLGCRIGRFTYITRFEPAYTGADQKNWRPRHFVPLKGRITLAFFRFSDRRRKKVGVRVAVASSDGKQVNAHFGRARSFQIYELAQEVWVLRENRENLPACVGHEHSDDALERTADLIADCRVVVVEQVGSGAVDVLLARRIMPFMLAGTVEEALLTLLDSRRFRYLRQADQGKVLTSP